VPAGVACTTRTAAAGPPDVASGGPWDSWGTALFICLAIDLIGALGGNAKRSAVPESTRHYLIPRAARGRSVRPIRTGSPMADDSTGASSS